MSLLDAAPAAGPDLDAIAADIWGAILGVELSPRFGVDGHAPDERVVTGHVQITGDWEGAVSVQTSHAFARRAAALMFDAAADDVSEDEVADTLGELANMTGGNVKSVLPGSCQLSLPSVTSGRDYQVSVPGSRMTQRRTLDADGELVVICLFERTGPA